ncbi:MAG: hypothetical protein ACE5KG_06585, partial [Nitrososphaerales archaeon]
MVKDKNALIKDVRSLTLALPLDELETIDSTSVSKTVQTNFDLLMTQGIENEKANILDRLREDFQWIKEGTSTESRNLNSIDSSSSRLNALLRGHPAGTILNFFGSRASGKTQILTQMAVNASKKGMVVIFVDCSGSFRPERAVEMARGQGLLVDNILRNILVIRCLSVAQQMDLVGRVKKIPGIKGGQERKRASLVLIDDITENFILGSSDATIIELRSLLARHIHQLSHLAIADRIPVVLTNSTRSRINQTNVKEVQTLSSIVERGTHTRIHVERIRPRGVWVARDSTGEECEFRISERGLLDMGDNNSASEG